MQKTQTTYGKTVFEVDAKISQFTAVTLIKDVIHKCSQLVAIILVDDAKSKIGNTVTVFYQSQSW